MGRSRLDAHVRSNNKLKLQAPNPAHLEPQNSLSFLALFFLIAFAFCGWGCSSGTGALAARALTSTSTSAASPVAPGSAAATPGAANGSGSSSSTGSPSSTPAPNTAPANAVSLLHFGNAGFGGDDTNVLQTALNNTAANGQTLEIPAGGYNINPVSFPANSKVFVDAGVTVTANSGYSDGTTMLNISS